MLEPRLFTISSYFNELRTCVCERPRHILNQCACEITARSGKMTQLFVLCGRIVCELSSLCDLFALRDVRYKRHFRFAISSLCDIVACVFHGCAYACACVRSQYKGTCTLALRVYVRFLLNTRLAPCEHSLWKGYSAPHAALSPRRSTLPAALGQCERVPSPTRPPSRRQPSRTTCRWGS